MRLLPALFCCLSAPLAAPAHPHIFVQAQVTLVFDGDAIGVRLDWYYDELFSLLVTSDLGLDMDGDLVLTRAEQQMLDDQIVAWPPDYTGDLEVMQGDLILPLSDKQNHSMTYADGLFHEGHLRPIADIPDPDAPLQIRVYDPSFYTAYDLQQPVLIEGRDDCQVQVIPADLDAAYAMAADLTEGQDFTNDGGPLDYFPAIGDAFADRIIVTCAAHL